MVNMRSGNSDECVLDRNASHVFGPLDRFLNAADCLVEFGDHTFAEAA